MRILQQLWPEISFGKREYMLHQVPMSNIVHGHGWDELSLFKDWGTHVIHDILSSFVADRGQRAELKKRGSQLRLTSDFGRPYKCVVAYWKSYQLDEWLHFLETFSLHLFAATIMPAHMWTMWTLLRSDILSLMRLPELVVQCHLAPCKRKLWSNVHACSDQ